MRSLILFLVVCLPSRGDLMVSASSLNRPIASVVTDNSITPSTNKTIISGGMTGVRVWTGEQSVSEPFFYLYVSDNGGAASKIQMFRWQGRIIPAVSGHSLSFGTTDGRTLKVTPLYAPAATETISGTNGTAKCDKAGPPIWIPSAAHITLPTNVKAFLIPAGTSEMDLFLSEYDGAAWTPTRWIRTETNRTTTVRTSYTKIALANYAGTSLSITCAVGSIVGGSSSAMTLPIPAVTGTSRNATTVATLKSAIAAAISGDEIVLSAGTYSLNFAVANTSFTNNHNVGGRKGMEGITIRGSTGIQSDVILTGDSVALDGNWVVNNDGGANNVYACFKDLSFNFASIGAQLNITGGKWLFQNVKWTGASSNAQDLFDSNVGNTTALTMDCLFCTASNSGQDCYNMSGVASLNAASVVRLIACDGDTSDATTAGQIFTTHNGLEASCYGGTLSNSDLNVISPDGTNSPMHAFFTTTVTGARSAGIQWADLFGCTCTLNQTGGIVVGQSPGYVLFTKVTCSGFASGTSLFRDSTFTNGQQIAHNRCISTAGRAYFPSIGGGPDFVWNITSGFGEGIRVANYGSGSRAGIACYGNTFDTSPITVNDTLLPCLLTNNSFTSASGTQITAGGATTQGAYNTFRSQSGYTTNANDTAGSNAALAANYMPTASGNCDGNGSTNNVSFIGSSDPFGLVLIYLPTRISRGARELPAIYSGAVLYPDLW